MPRVAIRHLPTIQEKVFARIPRADDLELHVKFTNVDGVPFLNLREYVPSREWYGRGIVLPLTDDNLSLLVGGIDAVASEAGIRLGV